MSTFTKRHLTHEIFRILPLFSLFLWTLIFIFSGPHQKCLWCYYRKLITSIALEKCKKNNAILFLLFWYKVFVHSILKLLNFLVDSVLNSYLSREPSVYLLGEELGDVENISRKNTPDITKLSYQAKNLMLTAKKNKNKNKNKHKHKQTKQNINMYQLRSE